MPVTMEIPRGGRAFVSWVELLDEIQLKIRLRRFC
jgi:hypothetical protein